MDHDQESGKQVKKLISAGSHVEAGMLMSLLAEGGIKSYEIDKESGNYMRIYMGYSVFGEDIYVKAEDFEAARELLASLEPGQEEIETDGAKADGAKADGAKADGAETDGAETDGAETDGAKTDAAKADGGKADAAETDVREADEIKEEEIYVKPRKTARIILALLLILLLGAALSGSLLVLLQQRCI